VASEQLLRQLHGTFEKLDKVDIEKLLRKGLGVESLEHSFLPQLSEIRRVRQFVSEYAKTVHDEYLRQAREMFESVANLMTNQSNLASAEYIGQRDSFVTQIDNFLRESRKWMTHFVAAAIEERGFLQDEGIRQEYRNAVEELKAQSAVTLETVRSEAERALEGAKKLAEEIEARARKTAQRISMNDAQVQFNAASTDLHGQVKNWRNASIGATILLVVVATAFMFWPLPDGGTWAVALYHTVIRVFVLGAVGSLSAFSFRMLRAHMHMEAKNRHRVRVANSAESFVNAALEPQQRDLLLAKLAEAIIDFGDSGLIKGEKDEHDSNVLSAEGIGRILAAITRRP
jgi:hypothetical protein